jgi:uncharacterized membrane-anchored protein
MMNRERLLIFITIMILSFMSGCSSNNTATESNLPLGVYVLQKTDEPVKPNVVLKDNNQFVFNYSVLSSYLPIGTYKIDNNNLILKTDDGEFEYIFLIKDNTLVFNKGESSSISFGDVEDGSVFVVQEKV